MAFTEKQKQAITKSGDEFLRKRRPPVEIRTELDLAYRIEGQSVFVYEIRPRWDNPDETMETPVAKTTFVKSKNSWKVYWMRGNLKWHNYKPVPVVHSIADFFNLVDEDELACFFG